MARYNSSLRSPKMEEEQQVPDTISSELSMISAVDEIDVMDELDEIWGFNEDEESTVEDNICRVFGREFMDWDDILIEDGKPQLKDECDENTEGELVPKKSDEWLDEERTYYSNLLARDFISGFWNEVEKCTTSLNLNLSLNYQEVMEAWSDRGSLWAEDHSPSLIKNNYMGEVLVMQDDRSTEREARVLRYKEKRQNRLFSKKIRYQVRKTNADQRPRLKGRFVRRV